MLEQQLVNALSLGCVYALFALGFTLVFGVLGVINLSHGAVFMVGAYAALHSRLLAASTVTFRSRTSVPSASVTTRTSPSWRSLAQAEKTCTSERV